MAGATQLLDKIAPQPRSQLRAASDRSRVIETRMVARVAATRSTQALAAPCPDKVAPAELRQGRSISCCAARDTEPSTR